MITSMRKEVEDLQELIIMQSTANRESRPEEEGRADEVEEEDEEGRTQTINGLEVI